MTEFFTFLKVFLKDFFGVKSSEGQSSTDEGSENKGQTWAGICAMDNTPDHLLMFDGGVVIGWMTTRYQDYGGVKPLVLTANKQLALQYGTSLENGAYSLVPYSDFTDRSQKYWNDVVETVIEIAVRTTFELSYKGKMGSVSSRGRVKESGPFDSYRDRTRCLSLKMDGDGNETLVFPWELDEVLDHSTLVKHLIQVRQLFEIEQKIRQQTYYASLTGLEEPFKRGQVIQKHEGRLMGSMSTDKITRHIYLGPATPQHKRNDAKDDIWILVEERARSFSQGKTACSADYVLSDVNVLENYRLQHGPETLPLEDNPL